jgi:hypothetical protein
MVEVGLDRFKQYVDLKAQLAILLGLNERLVVTQAISSQERIALQRALDFFSKELSELEKELGIKKGEKQ